MSSINPVTGSIYEYLNPANSTGSSRLNLSSDTLSAIQSTSSVGVITDASSPNLSLLEFMSAVSDALQNSKNSKQEFDAANGSYQEYYKNISSTVAGITAQIIAISNFKDDYNQYVSDFNSFNSELQGLVPHLNDKLPNIRDRWNTLYVEYENFNSGFGTFDQYLDALDAYNSAVDDFNGSNPGQNSTISKLAYYQNTLWPALDATRLSLNATIASLGLTEVPSFPANPMYPYGFLQRAEYDTPLPPFPNFNVQVNPYAQQTSISGDFTTANIDPLKEELKALKRNIDRTKGDVAYQEKLRIKFGQTSLGEVLQDPTGAPKDTSNAGPGTGGALSTLAASGSNPVRQDEKLGEAQLKTLYAKLEVPPPQLPQSLDSFSDTLTTLIASLATPAAAGIASKAIGGSTNANSPAVDIAVALASLQSAVDFINSGAIEKVVLQQLLADPTLVDIPQVADILSNKPNASLEGLAQGIVSALTLQLLKTLIIQVEQALGISGLLPQILASTGSFSKDAILELVNGLVNYKALFDSPIDKELVRIALSNSLVKNGLSQQEAQIALNRALKDIENQSPFASDEAAKQALKDSLLADTTIQSPTLSNAVDEGFKTLESQEVRNIDLTSDEVTLTPTQQLESELKLNSFKDELNAALLKENLDKEEAQNIAEKAAFAAEQNASIAERNRAATQILASQGVDNPNEIVISAAERTDSPLRTPFITEIASLDKLSDDFKVEVSTQLVNQGVPKDFADIQAEKYAGTLFTNPTSIASLVQTSVAEHSKLTGVKQSEVAETHFKDSIHLTLSTVDYLADIVDPAKTLVNIGTPYYGIEGPRIGTGGGVPITNPILG